MAGSVCKNLLMVAIIWSALFAGLIAPAILQGVRNASDRGGSFHPGAFSKV